MPSQLALNIYRGDSYNWTFTLFTDAAGNVPYDLAGATAKAEIRLQSGAPVLATLACTITQPNTIKVHLAAVDSADLDFAAARWDLQLTWAASGDVKTVVAGPVTVTPDITDSTVMVTAVAPSAWEQRRVAS